MKNNTIYILWHVHEFYGQDDDEKLIGVYSSETEAKKAIDRLKDQSGFKDHLAGFLIEPYELNKDHWTEGFSTVYPGGKKLTKSEQMK